MNHILKLTVLLPSILAGTGLVNLADASAAEPVEVADVSVSNPLAAEVADLKEQLENGLKARLPADFAFISKVVTLVEQDKLPISVVKAVFQWARKKGAANNYPFPYFQRALKIRAKKLGIVI